MQFEKELANQIVVCEDNQTMIKGLNEEIAACRKTIEKLREDCTNECESKKTLATALSRHKAMLDEMNADVREFDVSL